MDSNTEVTGVNTMIDPYSNLHLHTTYVWELECIYVYDGLSYWKSDEWDPLQEWAIRKYPSDHGWTDIYPEVNDNWEWRRRGKV